MSIEEKKKIIKIIINETLLFCDISIDWRSFKVSKYEWIYARNNISYSVF